MAESGQISGILPYRFTPTDKQARTIEEFVAICREEPSVATVHLYSGYFEPWLTDSLNRPDLSRRAEAIREKDGDLFAGLSEFLQAAEATLSPAQRAFASSVPLFVFAAVLLVFGVGWYLADQKLTVQWPIVAATSQPPASPSIIPTSNPTSIPVKVGKCPIQATPGSAPISPSDIDFTLNPSRDTLVVADFWSVIGVVQNRSKDRCVWIVDKMTTLAFAPEVYGATSSLLALYAYFPTYDYTYDQVAHHIIRIDPGGKYAFVWSLGSAQEQAVRSRLLPAWLAFFDYPYATLRDYGYFYPGTFRPTATMLVWSEEPKINSEAKNRVTDLTGSIVLTVDREIPIEQSQWVLIIGAAIGGVLARTFQLVAGIAMLPAPHLRSFWRRQWWRVRKWPLWLIGGYLAALLLPAVATVLLSRLSTSDFPVTVKVRDAWGAVAMGFVVQWFGYQWFMKYLSGGPTAVGNVTIDPTVLKLGDVAAGKASINVTARGLDANATTVAVRLVKPDGTPAQELIPENLPVKLTAGGFTNVAYKIPNNVGAGEYKVQVVPNTGVTVTSVTPLTIA